jgi:hypothetical protein
MNMRAILSLAVGGLVIGLLGGLAIGGDGGTSERVGAGPTKRVDGVPIGFERSLEGAVTAASAYAGVVEALAHQPSTTWDASIRRITAPDAAEKVAAAMRPGLQSLAEGAGGNSVLRGAPLGYRVASYTNSSANVDIWGVGVIGNPSVAPTATWGTTGVKLSWVNGDWRLAEPMSQSNGPTPALGGDPTPSEAFFASLRNVMDLDHVPER